MGEVGGYALLVAAGFAAGVINTIAGGGSFLTLPALFLFGLEPQLANGTNRVAVLCSSGTAVATFHRHGKLDRRRAWQLTIPTLCGVPVGTWLAVQLSPQAFEAAFGLLFLVMAALLLANPKRVLKEETTSDASLYVTTPIFVAIGVYVGFIQAGMGILLLLAMSLLDTGDLVSSNGVKNLVGFVVTLLAVVMFSTAGLVAWLPGLTMAVGNTFGGYVGAKLAIRKGNRLVFTFLVVVMVATGCKLLWSSWNHASSTQQATSARLEIEGQTPQVRS